MKKQDFSMYGRNKRGKKALCETCTRNSWYCPVRPRYYQCKLYIKKEKEVIMNIKEGKTIDIRKEVIEKACNWMRKQTYQEFAGAPFERLISDDLIDDFVKSMEE